MAPTTTRSGKTGPGPVAVSSRRSTKKTTGRGTLRRAALPRTPPKQSKSKPTSTQREKKGKEKESKACPICLEPLPAGGAAKRSLRSAGLVQIAACGHEFDRACLAQYAAVALKSNKGVETEGALPCPVPRCMEGKGGGLTPVEVKELVGAAAWEAHKERRAAHQIEMSTQLRYCPRVKCAAVNRVPVDCKGPATCKKCKRDFCGGCGLIAHPRRTCEQASDALYGKWKGKHKVKACPACGRHIEKNGGCSHMTCLKCKADWCWNCAKLLGSDPGHCTCYRHGVHGWW